MDRPHHRLANKGYPMPPRSACIGCPFHSDHEWRDMRDNRPEEWADAMKFDRALRPLDEAPIDGNTAQADLWGEECAGMCGV